jgi:glycosyltransferase involved in cell wall biosynthesis
MMMLSVCIPTYEMGGLGVPYLRKSLQVLSSQTFKDFEIVVSDNSRNSGIEELCIQFNTQLNIRYFHNTTAYGISANTNNAIKHARGKIVKILFQDDYLYSDESLRSLVDSFNLDHDHWMISACEHTHNGVELYRPVYPKYHDKIFLGKNTISSPSVVTIKNDNPLLFDENLTWLMDCDYYKRCFDLYGPPRIHNKINVVNRTGAHQASSAIVDGGMRKKEFDYIAIKYRDSLTIFDKLKLSLGIYR